MKKIIFGIIVLIFASCTEKKEAAFSLTGTTIGIENGTFLYVDYENEVLDSTKVENNSFTFTSVLPASPAKLWLHTKDFSTYRPFWAENKPMNFVAVDANFKNANITGSEIESLSQTLYQYTDSLPRQERIKKEMEFVKKHPNSIISAHILSVYATTWGREKTLELYEPFSLENKRTDYGQHIGRYIALNKEPKIGDQFVDFESENPMGEVKKLSELTGNIILLEFWASWCGPCRQENPNLVKTYQEFNPEGFEIFAVSLDENKESWIGAIEKDNLIWEHVSDLKGSSNEASLIYGINGIPDNFLLAEDGTIIGRNLRGEKLNEKLGELLN